MRQAGVGEGWGGGGGVSMPRLPYLHQHHSSHFPFQAEFGKAAFSGGGWGRW